MAGARRAKAIPTIYDVASRAGVSIASVSRVLNGQGSPKAETRKKVLRAVLVDQSHVEIAEGLASLEQSAVFLPRSIERLLAELPARLSD